ncbi:MAG TPA: biotin--[acetyl-CoA-carboxylase] ligase, partial [Caulobacteraceae bacterium]|nr:biotin--[acetyl-CoA-carboxylase] ligase [Caulobacteraceae bacterium]
VRLKWPNDLLVAGAKAAGILIESGRREDGGLWLAIGVGLNLVSAPQGLGYPATSLAAHLGQDLESAPAPEEALAVLSQAVAYWLAAWRSQGFEPVRMAWLSSAQGLDRRCVARLGERQIEGVAVDMDADGALVLRLDSGELQRITAGDVFFGST